MELSLPLGRSGSRPEDGAHCRAEMPSTSTKTTRGLDRACSLYCGIELCSILFLVQGNLEDPRFCELQLRSAFAACHIIHALCAQTTSTQLRPLDYMPQLSQHARNLRVFPASSLQKEAQRT